MALKKKNCQGDQENASVPSWGRAERGGGTGAPITGSESGGKRKNKRGILLFTTG
jgi:hypothetical protein